MALILQLDSTGQPNKWITWQAAVTYHAKQLVAWELGEVKNTVRGGTNARTGEPTIVITSSIMAVKGNVGKRKHRAPSLNNRELFRRDRHMCGYCGNVFSDSKLTRDHIVPTSKGGKDIWMNVVTCCAKCNQKKDNRTPQEARMELLYTPYVPSRAEHLILANRNILADQMEFLLAFVDEKSRVRTQLAA
jgi:5-methylcytosine-specific restriction endonuclease McrA